MPHDPGCGAFFLPVPHDWPHLLPRRLLHAHPRSLRKNVLSKQQSPPKPINTQNIVLWTLPILPNIGIKKEVPMKTKLMMLLVLACVFASTAWSQTVTNETYEYREIKDDPYHVADKIISMEFCGPVTFSTRAELSMGVGLNV